MIRFIVPALVAVALTMAAPQASFAAHHEAEAVIQVVTVKVHPGKLAKYQKQVKNLSGLLAESGSRGVIRMWNTTLGGSDAGNMLVAIEYPNAAAWAKDTSTIQASSAWRKIIGKLGRLRTVESTALWRDISPDPSGPGSAAPGRVLAITAVQVKPGRLADYRSRVGSVRGISERLGLTGQVRMWQADIAGTNTSGVAVGIEYPSLEAYVADQAKLEGDREWRRLLSRFGELRTLGGRWLYQDITP